MNVPTDRELLELAAKASGFGSSEGWFMWTESEYPRGSGKHGALWNGRGYMDTAELWNPLIDDGDALRLAVKMSIFSLPERFHLFQRLYQEELNRDLRPTEAARRAIVRAVTEIFWKVNP